MMIIYSTLRIPMCLIERVNVNFYLILEKADLAITDLTITSERQSAVDFTTPFMTLGKHNISTRYSTSIRHEISRVSEIFEWYNISGISVLYQIPTKAPTSLFSFLLPFSKNIWMYLIVAYITVTTLLFVIGKICPVEWINPYPCIKEPKALRTPFTLADTPFFVLGSLLKSPTGFAPAWADLHFINPSAGGTWFEVVFLVRRSQTGYRAHNKA